MNRIVNRKNTLKKALMKLFKLITAIAMALSLGPRAHAAQVSNEDEVLTAGVPPWATSMVQLNASIGPGKERYGVTFLIGQDKHTYFVFPAYILNSFTFTTPGQRTSFGLGGSKLEGIPALKEGETCTVEVDLLDVLNAFTSPEVEGAIKAANPSIAGGQRAFPELSQVYQAQLYVRDLASLEGQRPVGSISNLRPGARREHILSFQLSAKDFNLVKRSDLSLVLKGNYKAIFTKPNWQFIANYMDGEGRKVITEIASASGQKTPELIVPVGGTLNSSVDIEQEVAKSIQIGVRNFSGENVPIDVVRELIGRAFANFRSEQELAQEDKNKVVSFLLSDGLRVTAPISRFTELKKSYNRENDKKTHDLMLNIWKKEKKVHVDADIDVDVISIVDVGASANIDYSKLDEGTQKQIRDRFYHDLDKGEQIIKGELTGVVPMKAGEMRRLARSAFFVQLVSSEQARIGRKEFEIELQLTGAQTALSDAAGKIAALESKATQLQGKVSMLEGKVTTLQSDVDSLQASNSSLKSSLKDMTADRDANARALQTLNNTALTVRAKTYNGHESDKATKVADIVNGNWNIFGDLTKLPGFDDDEGMPREVWIVR